MLKLRIFNTKIPQELPPIQLSTETSKKTDFLVGRAPHCDVVLGNATVSREHGKIYFEENQYFFVDLGSTNGSQVNNFTLEAFRALRLAVNDTIHMGDFTILIEEIGIHLHIVPPSDDEEDPTEPSIAQLLDAPQVSPIAIEKLANEQPPKVVANEQPPKVVAIEPSQYMPLASLDPNQIERWTKGSLDLQCVNVIAETADVKTFSFVTNPPSLFTYKPGQFITLELEINGVEVLRSYSISSTPSRPHSLEITVKRVPSANPEDQTVPMGLVSNWLHDNVRVGTKIQASGTFGKFTCFEYPSQKLLFLSAGSGITPMLSMSRWIYDTHADCDVVFFHCARGPQDIICHQELEMMAARSPKFNLAVTVTRLAPQESWMGLRGRLTPAMLEMIAPDWRDRTVFVCGPESFMQSTKSLLEAIGFPMQQYHEESFGGAKKPSKSASAESVPSEPAPAFGIKAWLGKLQLPQEAMPVTSYVPNAPKTSKASAATVVFRKSGKEVKCDGEESILEVAEQAGVKIRNSCRVGSCGSCKKVKLEGEVKMEGYDPEALEAAEVEAGYILCCVAFPKGKVVIDV
ncbi:FHA domain-containing protein [Pseudanabaena yagii]|uniref:FHA domain-containing protein n=1 Tax=Pseudanabaena yagii GIHE-NHR1 TaxID=2722753 RepID=A0ABX1LTZ8_9CYAN|nr:FHA domain-containing protein [Pseudanabaena yagii]NMF59630.1 FHA domain-containing protein [Pseudanabaena yagii GIHE-NHR1]